ncbi:mannitol dehydrogenase family protein [Oribacterium sp. WCC10]|uniref:mannitol dehydrogenase family protein n=1 Tax=Oribacterium sp. WCC10 TaxID=1855343 RepID=UPI0008E8D54B|nr:mannitol dehydrogenase family protein [Oribacterium sp. WCC10]SFG67246.1 fructuronate reductase [Oribacterium sp. WCC10]
MKLSKDTIRNRETFEKNGYILPVYDIDRMVTKTLANPTWLHFGAGNIFKAFQAAACQKLLDEGLTDTGIITADRREKNPEKNDNLTIKVTLKVDGSVEKTVIGSIAEKLYLYGNEERLTEIFTKPSLQMVSFTITEKGYALYDPKGSLLPDIASDLSGTPDEAKSYMGKLTSMLYARYKANSTPLAMVSMDNCSHNGDKLKEVIQCFASKWYDSDFNEWLEKSVSFPWSMIDKITPGPDASVAEMLKKDGLDEDTPFVNAEEREYLVIEDDFPNGRPSLENAGIYFTTRETVDKVEHMKVCTCLNPLHTSLAVFGCLLGFDKIYKEMQDNDLRKLVEIIGYKEGLPVVTDPGIIKPRDFIDTVLNVRIPNPFMPDTPQRIATDTSQKLSIRFGETIKAYQSSATLDVNDLHLIPLVQAGWLRYLMAIDDEGNAFDPSPDPLLQSAQRYVSDIKPGEKPDYTKLEGLLRNTSVFGVDLVEAGLAERVMNYFTELTAGKGAVRATLHKYTEMY